MGTPWIAVPLDRVRPQYLFSSVSFLSAGRATTELHFVRRRSLLIVSRDRQPVSQGNNVLKLYTVRAEQKLGASLNSIASILIFVHRTFIPLEGGALIWGQYSLSLLSHLSAANSCPILPPLGFFLPREKFPGFPPLYRWFTSYFNRHLSSFYRSLLRKCFFCSWDTQKSSSTSWNGSLFFFWRFLTV